MLNALLTLYIETPVLHTRYVSLILISLRYLIYLKWRLWKSSLLLFPRRWRLEMRYPFERFERLTLLQSVASLSHPTANTTLLALCPRRPVSTRPTQRCSSTVSHTLPVVNNTTSGLQPWQLPAAATSAQRSQWSLLGKVGPPGELGVEEKGKGISVKVMRERALKMAMKRQHDLQYTNHFNQPLSFSPCPALSVIDWQT